MKHLIHNIANTVRDIARNESGSAMTEFVICLPVFVLVFIGINNLTKLEKEGIATKIRGTQAVWREAIPVQKGYDIQHMQPTIAGAMETAGVWGQTSTNYLADGYQTAGAAGLALGGTVGEAYGMTTIIDIFADLGVDPLQQQAGPVVNNSQFVTDLVDDGLFKPTPPGSGPLAVLNVILSVAGVKQAVGAGIRYGMAEGSASGNVNIMGKNFGMQAGYDVLVAPKPTDELWTTAVVRLTMENYQHYNGMLGIEFQARL